MQQWSILPDMVAGVWFVGDSIDDIQCGKSAGENSVFHSYSASLASIISYPLPFSFLLPSRPVPSRPVPSLPFPSLPLPSPPLLSRPIPSPHIGCKTCLVLADYNRHLPTTRPELVDLAVESLTELAVHLRLPMK